MFSDQRYRKPFIAALIFSLLIILLVLGAQLALANRAAAPAVQDAPDGWGDDGTLEVGVEWINDFPGTDGDRSHWDESCNGLYNQLLAEGWSSGFHWTDWDAWETDFKKSSAGGSENSYVDNVDIAMLCTHGSSAYDSFWNKNLTSVYFGSTHTDQHLSPGDAYRSYGDKDLEWLAFDSCSVLSDGTAAPYYNRGYWAATMNGLHELLGFKNTMYVSLPGDGQEWAYYMNGLKFFGLWWILPPRTVLQSWFTAVDYVQPSVTCARVLAPEQVYFDDYLWGKGSVSPDPVPDGYYYYLDHCSTDAKPASVGSTQPEILAMPIIQVNQRVVDETMIRTRIAPAFDISGTIAMDDRFYFMMDNSGGITRTLQVDRINGSYSYQNLKRLWMTPDAPVNPPTMQEAAFFLDNWFKIRGEGLPGVWNRDFNGFTYGIEQIIGMELLPANGGGLQEQQISSTPIDGVMTYPRLIPAKAVTANGVQLVDYPVYGPGGRLKIYFGGVDDIIGAQGGTRDVTVTPNMVTILDPAAAWSRLRMDPNLALPSLPLVSDTFTYTLATLGYYEMSYLQLQTELIPVWQFNTNFFANGVLVEENVPIYVPAADEYMPPEVSISAPADGSSFMAGETINFEGKVTGGLPPYTYEWTASGDGYLGNSLSLSTELTSPVRDGAIYTQNVSFQVTDANGMSSTATIAVNILSPHTWIPFLNK